MVKFRPLDGACSSMAERYTVAMALNMVGVAQLAERIPVEEALLTILYGGCSSIGRASPCGGECCGIVPRQPPLILGTFA